MDLFHHPPSPSDYRLAGDGLRLVRPYPFDFVCHVKRRNEGVDVVHLFARGSPPDRGDTTKTRTRAAPPRRTRAQTQARQDGTRAGDAGGRERLRGGRSRLRPEPLRPLAAGSAFATRFTATSLPFWTIPFVWWRRRTTWWRCTSPRRFPCTPRASTAKTQSSGFSPRSARISAGFSPRTGWIRTSPGCSSWRATRRRRTRCENRWKDARFVRNTSPSSSSRPSPSLPNSPHSTTTVRDPNIPARRTAWRCVETPRVGRRP